MDWKNTIILVATLTWTLLLRSQAGTLAETPELDGYPFADSFPTQDWNTIESLYNPMGNYYTGVVERCAAVGVSFSYSRSYAVYGFFNDTATTEIYTNKVNQLGPFTYLDNNSVTRTYTPPLDHDFIAKLDSWMMRITPSYVSLHVTDYVAWMNDTDLDDAAGYYLTTKPPFETTLGLAHRSGIGYGTLKTSPAVVYEDLSCDWGTWRHAESPWDTIAYFPGRAACTSHLVMAEWHYKNATDGWVSVIGGSLGTRPDMLYSGTKMITTDKPQVILRHGNTNLTNTITGTLKLVGEYFDPAVWVIKGDISLGLPETGVNISISSAASANADQEWVAIKAQSATISVPGATTNDIIQVIWTNYTAEILSTLSYQGGDVSTTMRFMSGEAWDARFEWLAHLRVTAEAHNGARASASVKGCTESQSEASSTQDEDDCYTEKAADWPPTADTDTDFGTWGSAYYVYAQIGDDTFDPPDEEDDVYWHWAARNRNANLFVEHTSFEDISTTVEFLLRFSVQAATPVAYFTDFDSMGFSKDTWKSFSTSSSGTEVTHKKWSGWLSGGSSTHTVDPFTLPPVSRPATGDAGWDTAGSAGQTTRSMVLGFGYGIIEWDFEVK
jgi:hypothetical protein